MTQIKARQTLYKGIQMRSRLEADYAATLDHAGIDWVYEPICFAADGVQWLPDFRLMHEGESAGYIEVKPAEQILGAGSAGLMDRIDGILRRMSVAWHSEPETLLQLVLHRYGEPWPDFEVWGSHGVPWMCTDNRVPSMVALVWPGMGQRDALPSAREGAPGRSPAHAR